MKYVLLLLINVSAWAIAYGFFYDNAPAAFTTGWVGGLLGGVVIGIIE
jgi:hypothetical protein